MNNTYETNRGSLEDEYRIYVDCEVARITLIAALGHEEMREEEHIKTFDEWLES